MENNITAEAPLELKLATAEPMVFRRLGGRSFEGRGRAPPVFTDTVTLTSFEGSEDDEEELTATNSLASPAHTREGVAGVVSPDLMTETVGIYAALLSVSQLPASVAVLITDYVTDLWRWDQRDVSVDRIAAAWRRFRLVRDAQVELLLMQWIAVYEAVFCEQVSESDEGDDSDRADGKLGLGDESGEMRKEELTGGELMSKVSDSEKSDDSDSSSEDDGDYGETEMREWIRLELLRKRLNFNSRLSRWYRLRQAFVEENTKGVAAMRHLLQRGACPSQLELWQQWAVEQGAVPRFSALLSESDMVALIKRRTGDMNQAVQMLTSSCGDENESIQSTEVASSGGSVGESILFLAVERDTQQRSIMTSHSVKC
jgi:hypothetical protein